MVGGQREAALQELHDRHASELWRFAMRLTHDRQLSEDVVQEVLLKAWKDPSLGQRDEAAARAWLFTASRNLIIDRWRSAASRHEQRIEEPPEESVGDATSVVLDRWLIAEALEQPVGGASLRHQRRLLRRPVGRGHLSAAPNSRGDRQVAAPLRTQNAQIGPTGERSDSAVNAIPDKFAQWDAAYVLGALSPAERGSSKSIWPAARPARPRFRNWLPFPVYWHRFRRPMPRCWRWQSTIRWGTAEALCLRRR